MLKKYLNFHSHILPKEQLNSIENVVSHMMSFAHTLFHAFLFGVIFFLSSVILSSSTIDKKLENFEFKFEFKVAINFEFVFEIFVNSQLRRSSRASAARSGSKGTL